MNGACEKYYDFDGETYEPLRDKARLSGQMARVFAAVRDRRWHTLAELKRMTGDPEASISARLRDLRKTRFGGFVVEREPLPGRGQFRYRVLPPEPDGNLQLPFEESP